MRNAFNLPSNWIHYNRFLTEMVNGESKSFAHRRIIIGNNGIEAFNFSFHRLFPHSSQKLAGLGVADGAICHVPRSLRNVIALSPEEGKGEKFVSKPRFFPLCQVYEPRITYSFACCDVTSFFEERDILLVFRNVMKSRTLRMHRFLAPLAHISPTAHLHKWKFARVIERDACSLWSFFTETI